MSSTVVNNIIPAPTAPGERFKYFDCPNPAWAEHHEWSEQIEEGTNLIVEVHIEAVTPEGELACRAVSTGQIKFGSDNETIEEGKVVGEAVRDSLQYYAEGRERLLEARAAELDDLIADLQEISLDDDQQYEDRIEQAFGSEAAESYRRLRDSILES